MAAEVRRVRAGDGAGRARLWQETGAFFAALDPHTAQEPAPDGLEGWHEELFERFAADPAVLMLVAELDGAIVGTAVARVHEPLPSAGWQVQRDLAYRRVHVDALAVAGAARRAGIGTALMDAVERWALDLGAAVITLETGLDNPTSMPFYEQRMGYTRHEVVFRKELHPPAPMTPDDVLDAMRPAELALWEWVRTRVDASIVREIAALDYGMQVEEHRNGLEDLLLGRRLPEELPWPTGAVLQLAGFADPDATDRRGHVARLFCCLVLVRTADAGYPAGELAALVESALALGPEAAGPALRFVAWCRRHRPGAWGYEPGNLPVLTLGLLVLYAAGPDRDPAVEATLLRGCADELRAVVAEWEPPFPAFKAVAGSERRRTWRALAGPHLTGQDPDSTQLRAWLRLKDPPAAQ